MRKFLLVSTLLLSACGGGDMLTYNEFTMATADVSWWNSRNLCHQYLTMKPELLLDRPKDHRISLAIEHLRLELERRGDLEECIS